MTNIYGMAKVTKYVYVLLSPYPDCAGDMFNNTPIFTSQGVDVTPFNDPCMTEGKLMLHDGCVDKPTPDNYTCEVRLAGTCTHLVPGAGP